MLRPRHYGNSERIVGVTETVDETVVNGAQGFFKHQFGIGGDSLRETWLLGLTNGAPYLFCAAVGCCKCSGFLLGSHLLESPVLFSTDITGMTHPMNKLFGRRGTIFISQVGK